MPFCDIEREVFSAAFSAVFGGAKLMKPWTSRRSDQTRQVVEIEPVSDVFDQTEKSLLAEAFSRPLGIGALLVLILSLVAFVGNHFMWGMDRANDFAMVAFFVSGGVLLSILLRSGEPKSSRTKAARQQPTTELLLDENLEAPGAETLGHRRQGLAESPAPGSPIPAAATASPLHAVDTDGDDEVAGYERALLHYAERGDMHGQGEILRRLGHTAKARGHLSESREFYMNARNYFKETDDHYAEAAVLLDLGQVLESLGDHDAASAAYRDANRALLDVAMNSSSNSNMIHAQAAD